jgi:hypothetical protein
MQPALTRDTRASQDAGRDQYITLTPVDESGSLAAPITARSSFRSLALMHLALCAHAGVRLQVKTYSCAEFSQKVACSSLSAPPPPANWTSQARVFAFALALLCVCIVLTWCVPQVNMGIYGRKLQQAGGATTAAAAAAPSAATVSGGVAVSAAAASAASAAAPAPAPASAWNEWAPLPASGSTARGGSAAAASAAAAECTGYFRQISFLSSVTLTASLTGVNASWGLAEAPCATEYITATAPVSVHVYNADLYPGDNPSTFELMAWCQTWPLHFDTPAAQPQIIVRGAGDPYTVAGRVAVPLDVS